MYFAACGGAARPAARRAVWLVLGVALAMRLLVLPAPPFLSSDMYRYVWDGRVQIAGINPYRYIPADPALRSAARHGDLSAYQPGRVRAHHLSADGAARVSRGRPRSAQTVLAMKAAMVGFELLAIARDAAAAGRCRPDAARVLIYAWNPLSVWAFAGNGHVDAIAIGLIALALLARVAAAALDRRPAGGGDRW